MRLCLWLVLSFSVSTGVYAAPLAFESALQAAEAQAPESKRAKNSMDLSDLQLKILDYDNDPKLSALASLSVRRPDPQTDRSETQDKLLSVQVSKSLYDFGRAEARRDQSVALLAAKKETAGEVTLALRFRVAKLFQSVVTTARSLRITAVQLDGAKARLEVQRRNFSDGLRPKSDLVAAGVDVGKVQMAYERAQADAQQARAALEALTGQSYAGEELSDGLLQSGNPQSFAQYTAKWPAPARPLSERRRDAERRALDAEEDVIVAAKRPNVVGSIGAQESGAKHSSPKAALFAQLALSWDIPWNGMARDELRRVGLNRVALDIDAAAEANERNSKDQLAQLIIAQSNRQWGLLHSQLKLLDEQQSLVQQRYQMGKASALDLSASENDRLNARLDESRLLHTLVEAIIDSAEARGVSDLSFLFNEGASR